MIYQTLKELRKRKGLTQTKMAELLHKSQNAYSLLEAGRSKIDAALIPEICKIFDITPDEFYNFDTPQEQRPQSQQTDLVQLIKLLKEELDKKNDLLQLSLKALSEVEKIAEKNNNLISFLNITRSYLSSKDSC